MTEILIQQLISILIYLYNMWCSKILVRIQVVDTIFIAIIFNITVTDTVLDLNTLIEIENLYILSFMSFTEKIVLYDIDDWNYCSRSEIIVINNKTMSLPSRRLV